MNYPDTVTMWLLVGSLFIQGILVGIFIEELREGQRAIIKASEWRTKSCA